MEYQYLIGIVTLPATAGGEPFKHTTEKQFSIQPGFMLRETVSQSKADVVDISKTARQSDTPSGKELKPAKARKIAAGLEPFFDE